ncbi:VWA domain-containing protein [Gordonia amarae]|uniref:VWFA domain-containing protein n=2 Tax=Gordonia amarae TaxID=36821 RepID=G7GW85_9ACTN|nr:substrate-binding domain-containing protein [Gordonia amarae]MCS3880992.1 Mg-chelatase subunit ChlD [Gordonia amarae]QHN19231.1 VWA domain-containing protein [Gordonia amarae]QHN23707.1 VWA domain-containing protein [Gordonia amarae]QHN32619.1 VWA domain-containing protein [Gordonia amarae]QHN41367.1 VWA domain-containing protein [Gordonia amarae]
MDAGVVKRPRVGRHGQTADLVSVDAEHFGFERRRGSRRTGPGSRLVRVFIGLMLVAALAASVFLWRNLADGCGGDRSRVSVVVDSSISAGLKAIADRAADDSCFDFAVTPTSGADVPARLTAGGAGVDLWLADSQIRAERVMAQVRRTPEYVTRSLASSPVVVVGTKLGQLTSWADVMNLDKLQVGSPMENSAGDAPIIGGAAAVSRGEITRTAFTQAMTAMAAQRHKVIPGQDTDDARMRTSNVSDIPSVASEQQYLMFKKKWTGSQLAAKIPADGTLMLDYPLMTTASPDHRASADAAGRALVAAAASDEGRKMLQEAGFRNPDGSGIGRPVKTISAGDSREINEALRSWQILSVPMRMLNVLDTSGSMQAPAGSSTRAQLLAETVIDGTKLLGDASQVGVWIFGIDRGTDGADWKQIVPIRRLDEVAAGVTQRQTIATTTREAMRDDLGGGTGLYDTTLAAYKAMVDGYDPAATNTLAIVTDGRNEDDNSITLDDLVTQLKALQDPGRPVRIVAIGITSDADADSLNRIAEVTGGTSYIAETPMDIRGIFTTEAGRLLSS